MKKVFKWMWKNHKSQYPKTKGEWTIFWLLYIIVFLLLVDVVGK